jgi:hypothetical protein
MVALVIRIIIEGLVLFAVSTVVFDIVHWILHQFDDSKNPLLKYLSDMHQAHHDFLDTRLTIQDEFTKVNIFMHIIPEFMTRAIVTLSALLIFHPIAVWLVMLVNVVLLIIVLAMKGKDPNHFETERLIAPRSSFFVDSSYHLLHHVYPHQYYSSMVRAFDWLFGYGCQFEGKRVLVTGGSGALGKPMQELLKKEGVASIRALKFGKDWDYSNYAIFDELLPETDILILAHGSKMEHAQEANCDSFVTIIEKFRREAETRLVPVEVWAVGSEIEAHPHFGVEELKIYKASKMAYARHARFYYNDRTLLYRHIVPSAFTSPMGPGLISGMTAARIAMFFIRRGFHYVPVTYTGIAFLNWFKYLFGWNATPAKTTPSQTADAAS